MRKSEFFEMNLFDEDEFYSEEQINENTEKIDEVLNNLENPTHDTTTQANVEELKTGENIKVALRKLAKAVADYIIHKADKIAHITAEERTAWNAKLGAEKIAANLTTTEEGMLLDATMGKKLQEQISTLNSNIGLKKIIDTATIPANGVYTTGNLDNGMYLMLSNQGGSVYQIMGIAYITITNYNNGCTYHCIAGGEWFKQITATFSDKKMSLSNPASANTFCWLYKFE